MKNKKIIVSVLLIIAILSSSIESLAKSFDLSIIFDGRTIAMESEDTDMSWDLLNFIPGSSDVSSVTITNNGKKPTTVETRINIEENDGLLDMIDLKVTNKAGKVVYTGSYTEYKDIAKVFAVGESEKYTVETSMNVEAGNEYQNKQYKLTFSFKATGQIPMGTLTVRYVDENGNDLEPSQIDTKKITEKYELPDSGKEFEGYRFDNVTGKTSGYYEEDGVEVVYHYHFIKYGNLIVKHVIDEEDGRVIEEFSDIQEVGTEYSFPEKGNPPEGYVFVRREGNNKGKYVEGTTEITYHYSKYEDIKDGRLIVQCVDENNEVIKETITTEKVGTDYDLGDVGEEIDGYKFLGVEGKTKGKYVEEDTIVTYKYKKRKKGNVIVVCIDENNEIIKRDVTTEEVETDYDLGNVGEEIEGYTFEGVEGETKGKYKVEDTIVTYKYKKKQAPFTEEIRLPKTGDNNIIVYAGILLGAIILIIIITKKRK